MSAAAMTSPLPFDPLMAPSGKLSSSPLTSMKLPSSISPSTSHPPRSPRARRCSIAGCTTTTTSGSLSKTFLSLSTLCFPPVGDQLPFDSQSSHYLCAAHRAMLTKYRELAVTHAERNTRQWTGSDNVHGEQSMEHDTLYDDVLPASTLTQQQPLMRNYDTFNQSAVIDMDGERSVKQLDGHCDDVPHWLAKTGIRAGWAIVCASTTLVVCWATVGIFK